MKTNDDNYDVGGGGNADGNNARQAFTKRVRKNKRVKSTSTTETESATAVTHGV